METASTTAGRTVPRTRDPSTPEPSPAVAAGPAGTAIRVPVVRALAAAGVAAAALLLAGCGVGLGVDSSCAEYMTAPRDQQDAAVSELAVELGASNAVTPLGRPNIDYQCAGNGELSLREAVERTG